MKVKEGGKGKAGEGRKPGRRIFKAAVKKNSIQTHKKTTWEEVVEKEELAETKRADRNLPNSKGRGVDGKS
jgi:hypothetical protein